MARRIANCIALLILVGLFVFPSRFLCELSDEIVSVAEDTVDAVHRQDWDVAQNNMQAINTRFRKTKDTLQLFLHHGAVEQLDGDLRATLQLIHSQDEAQTLMELEFIISTAMHLKCIETFNWSTFL